MLAKQTMTSDIKREQRHMTLEIQVMAWDRYIKTDDDRHTKTDDDKCLLEFNFM